MGVLIPKLIVVLEEAPNLMSLNFELVYALLPASLPPADLGHMEYLAAHVEESARRKKACRRERMKEDKLKECKRRIERLEDRMLCQEELRASLAAMANEQDNMKLSLNEIKLELKRIALIPAKRWENLFEKLIWAALAGGSAYILGTLGL